MKINPSIFSKETLLNLLKNKYFIATAAILIWMTFLDRNNLIHQVQKSVQLNELKSEKQYYKEKIKETRKARKDLMKNSESLERYAREQYFMKKPDEELYIVAEPESNN